VDEGEKYSACQVLVTKSGEAAGNITEYLLFQEGPISLVEQIKDTFLDAMSYFHVEASDLKDLSPPMNFQPCPHYSPP
jgi:hypothetical protein